jgi:hypothetical protein
MEINPNSPIIWSRPPATAPGIRTAPELPRDRATFDEIAKLRQAMGSAPDIRPTVVARAKSLLGDVNYPPMETIQRIGELLAAHFSESPESSNPTES